MTRKEICKDCKYFPDNRGYAFCINANHSGRLEVMSSFPACDKFKKGNYELLFAPTQTSAKPTSNEGT